MADHAEKDGHTPPMAPGEQSSLDEKDSSSIKAMEAPAGAAADEKPKRGRFDKTFEEEKGPKHALVDMSQIELKAEDLYNREKLDIEQVEMTDVWQVLQCALALPSSHRNPALTRILIVFPDATRRVSRPTRLSAGSTFSVPTSSRASRRTPFSSSSASCGSELAVVLLC